MSSSNYFDALSSSKLSKGGRSGQAKVPGKNRNSRAGHEKGGKRRNGGGNGSRDATVPHEPWSVRGRELLCVDGLNYCRQFFCGDQFNVANLRAAIRRFTEAASASGYTLEVFLDVVSNTAETIAKWCRRREKEVRDGKRNVIQGMTQFMGDAFRECGVKVHYSIEDNDDTIVSHAAARDGHVLSHDHDMFRYAPQPYHVFDDFEIIRGRLYLHPHANPKAKSARRALPAAPMATHSENPLMLSVSMGGKYMRGVPTPLVKTRSNTHLLFRPLREAVYAKMLTERDDASVEQKDESFTVEEEFPIWKDGQVQWQCDTVSPSDEFNALLSDAAGAVRLFGELKDGDAVQHTSGVWVVALELVRYANPDGPSLMELYLNTPGSPGYRQAASRKARRFRRYFK